MKLALFGATGPTGKYLINEALKQGYDLSVYTRDANKLKEFEGRIEVVIGDLKDADAIGRCVQGAEAVISALGPNSFKSKEERPIMKGVKTLISAMNQNGVKRLIQVSTASYRDPQDGFDLKTRLFVALIKLMLFPAYDDIRSTGELIRNSGLDWTLVRIPNLKSAPADGKIKTGLYGKTKLSLSLSRGNLAKFLVDQVGDRKFIRAAPAIANH